MSLVLGYANKDNAIIISDGKAGNNEYYNKTYRVNKKIIIGCVGYAENFETLIRHFKQELENEIFDMFFDDFIEYIKQVMNDSGTKEHFKSTIMIIGKNKNEEVCTCIVGKSTNYIPEINKVDEPRILSIGGTINADVINDIYTKNIRNVNLPITQCLEQTFVEVYKLDNSVNSNTFTVAI